MCLSLCVLCCVVLWCGVFENMSWHVMHVRCVCLSLCVVLCCVVVWCGVLLCGVVCLKACHGM